MIWIGEERLKSDEADNACDEGSGANGNCGLAKREGRPRGGTGLQRSHGEHARQADLLLQWNLQLDDCGDGQDQDG